MDISRLIDLAHARLDVVAKAAFVAADASGVMPVDPAAGGGGMPPMDPAMMAAGGGGMPPMDPSMMAAGGGMPPMPGGGGMPPMDPAVAAAGGGMPPAAPTVDPMMQLTSKIDMLIGEIRGFMAASNSGGGGKSKSAPSSANNNAGGGGDSQQIMQTLSSIASALGVQPGGQAGGQAGGASGGMMPSQFSQALGTPGTPFPGGMPGSGMTVQASALSVDEAARRFKRALGDNCQ